MLSQESAERVICVLDAAQGPFRSRGRRHRYDESKYHSALDVMPALTDDERRYVVALLTRTKLKHQQDASWLTGTAYASVGSAIASALALEGLWRAVTFAVLVGLGTYIQGKVAEHHEPAIAYTEGLLAALGTTPRPAEGHATQPAGGS